MGEAGTQFKGKIADYIGVSGLRNDTWPTHRQDVPGEARHNIWHFPSDFRSSPGVSERIIILA
jgi:hypothetical protein